MGGKINYFSEMLILKVKNIYSELDFAQTFLKNYEFLKMPVI